MRTCVGIWWTHGHCVCVDFDCDATASRGDGQVPAREKSASKARPVGHGLLLTMEKGSNHRTGLDLLAAGALLALGLKELLERREEGQDPPAWTRQLDRFCAMPLPLLLGTSCAIEVISPDDLFLFAKTASALLASDLSHLQEVIYTAGFTLAASLALLLPFGAVLVGRDRVVPLLEKGKQVLFARGDLLVGGLSLVLAGYLGWQGIEGLQLS